MLYIWFNINSRFLKNVKNERYVDKHGCYKMARTDELRRDSDEKQKLDAQTNKNKSAIITSVVRGVAILQLLQVFLLQLGVFSRRNRRWDRPWTTPRNWRRGLLLLRCVTWLGNDNLLGHRNRRRTGNNRNGFGANFL